MSSLLIKILLHEYLVIWVICLNLVIIAGCLFIEKRISAFGFFLTLITMAYTLWGLIGNS